jgi:hypothetical protein
VIRSILSIGLAIFIVTAVTSASCFNCLPGKAPMKADCCKNHHKCPMPVNKSKTDCGSPAIDSFTTESIVAADGQAPAVTVAVPTAFVPADYASADQAAVAAYSPPDLRILNSSLTI